MPESPCCTGWAEALSRRAHFPNKNGHYAGFQAFPQVIWDRDMLNVDKDFCSTPKIASVLKNVGTLLTTITMAPGICTKVYRMIDWLRIAHGGLRDINAPCRLIYLFAMFRWLIRRL